LPWVVFGKSDFVGVTIAVNAAQVVIIPVLVIGIWVITSRADFIGKGNSNNRMESIFIALIFLLSCVASYLSLERIITLMMK